MRLSRRALIGAGVKAGATVALAGLGGLRRAAAAPAGTVVPRWLPRRQPQGSDAASRAIEGARALKAAGKIPSGFQLTVMVAEGSLASQQGDNGEIQQQWQEATGVPIQYVGVPIEQLYDKIALEAIAKTGEFDTFHAIANDLGDFVALGVIEPLDEWVAKYGPDIDTPAESKVLVPKFQYVYAGKQYGAFSDGGTFFYYINREMLENEEERKNFKAKYGYELKPADTWDEYRDQSEFFHRPDKGIFGSMEQRNLAWDSRWWHVRYGSLAFPNQYYFDDDMNAIIGGPEGIQATREFVDQLKYLPPDILNVSWPQTYPWFAQGQAFSCIAWNSMAKYASNPAVSQIAGKFVSMVPPGRKVGERLIKRSLSAGANTFVVNHYSKVPELAYLYLQWLWSPAIDRQVVTQKGGFLNINRLDQFSDPLVIEAHSAQHLKVAVDAYQVQLPQTALAGNNEYDKALDLNLQAALTGAKTPEQAMTDTAAAWNEITERKGRDRQIEAWKYLKSAYPQGEQRTDVVTGTVYV